MRFLLDDEDVGYVELDLKSDNTFSLQVKIEITAQIDIEGDINDDLEGVDETYDGTWEIANEEIILTFNSKPKLSELFNPELDPSKTTKIISENKASFKKDSDTITIRGVYCEKK